MRKRPIVNPKKLHNNSFKEQLDHHTEEANYNMKRIKLHNNTENFCNRGNTFLYKYLVTKTVNEIKITILSYKTLRTKYKSIPSILRRAFASGEFMAARAFGKYELLTSITSFPGYNMRDSGLGVDWV